MFQLPSSNVPVALVMNLTALQLFAQVRKSNTVSFPLFVIIRESNERKPHALPDPHKYFNLESLLSLFSFQFDSC